jgi:multidrug resistance efflux pump
MTEQKQPVPAAADEEPTAGPVAEPDETPAEAPAPANPLRKIVLVALALMLILFIYHVLADRFTPYSSVARIDTYVTQVAPEVSGDVLAVGVSDNHPVRKGQLLFRIDPEPYQIALRSAEANLSVALQAADVSVATVAAADANVSRQRADLSASREIGSIVTQLVSKKALAETQGIRATADVAKTTAALAAAEADLRSAQANLGAPGFANPKVRQAVAALDKAKLDLSNTEVRAPADGIVTNLRLAKGQFVGPGQPLLTFILSQQRWISADMRENQLGNLAPGQPVTIALDARPGELFHGQVQSVGWGVSQGDEVPTGHLSSNPPSQGWLRDPQRFPVRIQLLPDDARKAGIDVSRSGAQANVIVFTGKVRLLNPIGRLWIWIVAMLSYLQ